MFNNNSNNNISGGGSGGSSSNNNISGGGNGISANNIDGTGSNLTPTSVISKGKHQSPFNSLKKKGQVVRQSLEELFIGLSTATNTTTDSGGGGSGNNSNNSSNTSTPQPIHHHKSNSNSSLLVQIAQNNQSLSSTNSPSLNPSPLHSPKDLDNKFTIMSNNSNNSSPRTSDSVDPTKSLAKFYFLAQQLDYVGGSYVSSSAPYDPLLPVETLSGILSVQWTTYWTIPLAPSTTCLDILKYISVKTNREVAHLKLGDSDGKIIDHDYTLIQQRCKKFIVFEDINIEEFQPYDSNNSNIKSSSSTSPTPGSPNLPRKAPPPPPRSPSSFTNDLLLDGSQIDSPLLLSRKASNSNIGSFINHSDGKSFLSGGSGASSPLAVKESPPDSPSFKRKASNNPLIPSPVPLNSNNQQQQQQQNENYCTFLDQVILTPNPPTTEKGKILDNYFNHYYQEMFKYIHNRSRRLKKVEDFIMKSELDEPAARQWRNNHYTNETNYLRNKRAGMKLKEFKILTQIGKGGFGQVFLATKKDTGDIVTLKRIKKSSYEWANQRNQVSQERDIMLSENCKWITKLLYSFQDSNYLYLAMEYHCGGDFRALLNNLGALSEEEARFYMVEMIEAVTSLHKMGIVHRDIKPSNFVIDKHGHIKLIDFGLSKEGIERRNGWNHQTMTALRKSCIDGTLNRNTLNISTNGAVMAFRRPTAHSAVGSPEYMAPEIVNDEGYDLTCDYWSLGCAFIEMLCGFNPFCADTPNDVFINIIRWRDVLDWDLFTQELSPEAADLLKSMLTEPSSRLGVNGIDDFKNHPFFNQYNWDDILQQSPPFVPKVESDIDTSYFEDAVNNDSSTWEIDDESSSNDRKPFSNLNIPFFTYRKSSALSNLSDFRPSGGNHY
ncbi:hypothetical protein CYY_004315 [Polysphondylium violaceum]|uniref:non-specific serine/threonine protein kinase n=1 Tax=Polysphondylium violaceum TaxID=133409 RepID=A0A8J4Q5L9_9MYCE|nr:hypothetical protein CYY_004315 [Polysphondylium violaceum]